MSNLRRMIATTFAVGVLLAGITTMAQTRTYRGTYQSVRNLIYRIENRTDIFRNSLENSFNQTGLNGTTAEDNIRMFVSDFDSSVERLKERFNSRQSTAADAQEVLNRAALIDRFMNRRRANTDATVVQNWANLRTQLNQLESVYGVTWPRTGRFPSSQNPSQYPSQYPSSTNQLTGTYRLDASRSDDPRDAANRATQSLPYRDRQRISDDLTARLESPDQIAIDVRGRRVTIASSRAPQISFDADGSERVEQTRDGRNIRARATITGDQLIVSSNGDRLTDFTVTFDPIDNGRRLSVTRRVYVNGLTRPVVVQSTYDKTAEVARFDIQGGYDSPIPTTSGDFVIPNGESLTAELNDDLSTRNATEGQTFTATVRQPAAYEGAILDGRVTHLQRGGRISGRSELTLTFDNIRMRDGRTYRFAGILENVRLQNGDVVKVDNEGAVQDDNQTTKTVQRAAIGTAVGAIIGAIAGGGKGAAIGAIIGAGGGAGSVYVQGRDDLDLTRGTELTIRASAPR
ncbi:MAG TPA: YMGG-like glycine zipper-containing protein [Pyrinomonadaceae bacterium]|nr:YMGG-like glycine zipper-containing protein [Pyrinomonadaceae bacterium]